MMRVILDHTNMVDTGWELRARPALGIVASHEDRKGKVTLVLRDLGDRLEFTPPRLESFDDAKFMAHLFDVLAENGTTYSLA